MSTFSLFLSLKNPQNLNFLSVTIYNLKEKIKMDDLENLRFFTEYGK